MSPSHLILGIESSCDETAVAIVDGNRVIRAQRVRSQIAEHKEFGGVVPEIAARAHLKVLDALLIDAMREAGISRYQELSAVAVTGGPGLIGGVMVGVAMAKAIAYAAEIPFLAINHLEGHALTVRLTDNVAFPYMLLLVSGGHCQILIAHGVGRYEKLGETLDDAVGEAFDKVAKTLGLEYPGGPEVEKKARKGDPKRFAFPRSLTDRKGCDFSFSGLKTAVRREVERLGALSEQDRCDVCASFQVCVADILVNRIKQAIALYKHRTQEKIRLVVAGGVAANQILRSALQNAVEKEGGEIYAPPIALCTDNAVMIAWAGMERFRLGQRDNLDFSPRARWPL